MKKKKINPQEFDCGCCGNQIYKSRLRDEVKCCYCGYINHRNWSIWIINI